MELLVWLVILAIPLAIIAGIIQATAGENNERKAIEAAPDFSATENFVATEPRTSIAIDQSRRKIRLSDGMKAQIVGFEQIVSAEVAESGISVTKTHRGSQLAGALIGGAMLGGAGAVIGGLSGKSSARTKGTIELRIVTDDPSIPFVAIPFLSTDFDTRGQTYKHFLQEAHRWHGRLAAIIRECDRSRSFDAQAAGSGFTRVEIGAGHLAKVSIADELQKLAKLKLEGVITEEEFANQKRRLLGEA